MRVIVTGGGTGGHLYPAISIARALREGSGADVAFVGSAAGPEAEVAPREGFAFHALPSRKLDRRPSLSTPRALAVLAWGTARAALLLRRLGPDAVVGTGGYVSAGVVLAAALLRIPTVIHEQNAVAGRTNRLLGRLVTRVAVSFEESAASFPPGKSVCTGLPIRPEFATASPEAARRQFGLDPARPTLLVVGGSQGARRLNEIVTEALPSLLERGIQIVHQIGRLGCGESRVAPRARLCTRCGKGDPTPPSTDLWEAGETPALPAHGAGSPTSKGYHPVPYLVEVASALAAADVILCRAGASTLAEVAAVGRPALLVPYPYAVHDHQTRNAQVFAERGAALLLPESELTVERLLAELDRLLGDAGLRLRMREALAALARPDAARRVAELVCAVTGVSGFVESRR